MPIKIRTFFWNLVGFAAGAAFGLMMAACFLFTDEEIYQVSREFWGRLFS